MSVQRTFEPGEVNHPAGSWVAVYPNGRERVFPAGPSARREATRAALMAGGRVYQVGQDPASTVVADSGGGAVGGPAAPDDQTGSAAGSGPAAPADSGPAAPADSGGGAVGGPAAPDDQTGSASDSGPAAPADSGGGAVGGPAAPDDQTDSASDSGGGAAPADDNGGKAGRTPGKAVSSGSGRGGRGRGSLLGEAVDRVGDTANAALSGLGETAEDITDAVTGKRAQGTRTPRKGTGKK